VDAQAPANSIHVRFGGASGMFITIAVILFILWILGFGVFHVAGGLIHILIVLAIIAAIVHFVRGRPVV
jgi:hypothetical protein